jgi:DNA repair photolyase
MIKEILCQKAIDYEYPPDGGKTPVLDAYDGCQLCCPYCFQWRDPAWNQDILVKVNFPETLIHELADWDANQTLYIGSRSDPYMALESRYRLTRKTLQVLLEHNIPCILSTKSNSPAFFDDIPFFQQYGKNLILCIGQANVTHLQKMKNPSALPNLRTVNRLVSLGIQTWVFITPVLPGITDVKRMIDALPDNVPVFLDKLRLEEGSAYKNRFFEFLKSYDSSLEPRYRRLMQVGTDPYYQELKEMYQDEPRVQFVFGEN